MFNRISDRVFWSALVALVVPVILVISGMAVIDHIQHPTVTYRYEASYIATNGVQYFSQEILNSRTQKYVCPEKLPQRLVFCQIWIQNQNGQFVDEKGTIYSKN